MKRKKFFCLYLIVFLALVNNTNSKACPDCDTSKFILAIYPENLPYLVYGNFMNVFDTCNVSMKIGEFRIKDSFGTSSRLFLEIDSNLLSLEHPNVFLGEGGQGYLLGVSQRGEDSILSSVLKTNVFKYSANSKLLFFRQLRAGIKCLEEPEQQDTTLHRCPDIPPLFLLNKYCIHDTSEWVVQLIDASNHHLLAVLDSVGFLPNGECPYGIAYGTNPYRMNQERSLPNEFANKDVYIKISVRRFGPTLYGMLFNIIVSRLNFSSIYEYNELCDFLQYSCKFDLKWFDNFYFNKVISYLDSIVSVNNRPPYQDELPLWYFFDIDSNYTTRIYNRYYPFDSSVGGWVIPPRMDQINIGKANFNDFNTNTKSKIILSEVKSRLINNHINLELHFKFKPSLPSSEFKLQKPKVEIYNLTGQIVYSANFEDTIILPYNPLNIKLDKILPKGSYLLVISTSDLEKPLSKTFLLR
ncbi:MAG: hypothetical protein N2517_00860 [Ignavibacteria bacterium]|nr:hypothetical protein [Ignavibacteria bacterium]